MQRYRQVLAVLLVLIFLSSLELYLFLAEYTTVTPRDWVTLLAVLVSPLVVSGMYRRDGFNRQFGLIGLWSIVYVAIAVIWYSCYPSPAAFQEVRDRIFAAFFMTVAGLLFVDPQARRASAVAAMVVVLVTIAVNAIQMVQPGWFVMGVTNRASGLYGNPNQCGAALVVGMIIGSPIVPRRFRLSFSLAVAAGIAMTFSRSTMAGFVVAAVLMLAVEASRSRVRDFAVGLLAATALLIVLVQGAASMGLLDGVVLDDSQIDRVSFFKTFEASDDAAQERRDVAGKAWQMFIEHPLQGNGVASTVQWTEAVSTHNMFLYFMADHGLIGVFILPALMIFALVGRPAGASGPHWAFFAFTLWYSFFSHNILSERYYLLGFAFFVLGGVPAAGAPQPVRVRQGLAMALPVPHARQASAG